MAYWLFKSEPYKYSWDELVKDGSTHWDGVRNFEAAKNMKSMKVGDRGFYYHSNKGKEIVGICEVVKEYYPDHTDESGRFGMVDVKAVEPISNPVTLAEIKANPALEDMALVRRSRLSVTPVTDEEWEIVLSMENKK